VGGEDYDRDGQANDRDHRDRQQRSEMPVVRAEFDGGVLCGNCLGHSCLLWWAAASASRLAGWCDVGVIVSGRGCAAAMQR
jgi:hypothetical protein